MLLLQYLATAAFGVAAAQAFLLVPEASVDAIKGLSFDQLADADTRKVDVACPGCPLTIENRHGEVKVMTGKQSHLELSFAIEHQVSGDRLVVNGFELYPNADPFNQVLTALHKPDCKKKNKAKNRHQGEDAEKKNNNKQHKAKFVSEPLGFSLLVSPVTTIEDDKLELIAIDLQIVEVAHKMVDGIPNVHIDVVRTSGGGLMIGSVEMSASQAPSSPADKQSECTTLLCKWTAMIEESLSKFKPFNFKHCGGKGKTNPAKTEDGEAAKSPHHGTHHHHHHGGGRKHSWGQLFKSIASHILLPILIGIVAGVSVSIIGMMAGTCVVALWRTFFRRHRHGGHAHHRAVQKEVAVVEEKTGLMEQQEAPPAYDEDDAKKTSA